MHRNDFTVLPSKRNESVLATEIFKAVRGTPPNRQGNWDEVFRLLDQHNLHPDTVFQSEGSATSAWSLLLFAATEASPEGCEGLLRRGANPRLASTGCRPPIVEMVRLRTQRWGTAQNAVLNLLKGTVNIGDSAGMTALMFASIGAGAFSSKRGNIRLIERLMQLGADPTIKDNRGQTALMHAVRANKQSKTQANDSVEVLLKSRMFTFLAEQKFSADYFQDFSDDGTLTVTKKPVLSMRPVVTPGVTEKTKERAIRADAGVGTVSKRIEKTFGLPANSVALVDARGRALQEHRTIADLRRGRQ